MDRQVKYVYAVIALVAVTVQLQLSADVWVSTGINVQKKPTIDFKTKKIIDPGTFEITVNSGTNTQLFKQSLLTNGDDVLIKEIIQHRGLTFVISSTIYSKLLNSILNLPASAIASIRTEMVKKSKAKSTDTDAIIKTKLTQALDDFMFNIVKSIVLECAPSQNVANIRNQHIQDLDTLIKSIKFEKNTNKDEIMKGLSAIEKDLIGIFRFTPTINLLDNRSQFVAPYRTLYYEIEKLGQSFGFSCEPIDSTFWAKTKKRLSNPYIWAVLVAGAGLSWLWQSSTTSTPPSQLDGITSGIQAPTPAKAPGIFESFGQGFKQ